MWKRRGRRRGRRRRSRGRRRTRSKREKKAKGKGTWTQLGHTSCSFFMVHTHALMRVHAIVVPQHSRLLPPLAITCGATGAVNLRRWKDSGPDPPHNRSSKRQKPPPQGGGAEAPAAAPASAAPVEEGYNGTEPPLSGAATGTDHLNEPLECFTQSCGNHTTMQHRLDWLHCACQDENIMNRDPRIQFLLELLDCPCYTAPSEPQSKMLCPTCLPLTLTGVQDKFVDVVTSLEILHSGCAICKGKHLVKAAKELDKNCRAMSEATDSSTPHCVLLSLLVRTAQQRLQEAFQQDQQQLLRHCSRLLCIAEHCGATTPVTLCTAICRAEFAKGPQFQAASEAACKQGYHSQDGRQPWRLLQQLLVALVKDSLPGWKANHFRRAYSEFNVLCEGTFAGKRFDVRAHIARVTRDDSKEERGRRSFGNLLDIVTTLLAWGLTNEMTEEVIRLLLEDADPLLQGLAGALANCTVQLPESHLASRVKKCAQLVVQQQQQQQQHEQHEQQKQQSSSTSQQAAA